MLFPIVIAALVAGTVAYFIFKGKKTVNVVPPITPVEEPVEEVGYESAPSVVEEKPKKARKPRAKKNA